MVKGCEGSCLSAELLPSLVYAGRSQLRVYPDFFDGAEATLEAGVRALVDGTHATLADELQHPVAVGKYCVDLERLQHGFPPKACMPVTIVAREGYSVKE